MEISARVSYSFFTCISGITSANQLEVFFTLLVLIRESTHRIAAVLSANSSTSSLFKNVFYCLFGLFEFDIVFIEAELIFFIQLLGLLFLLQALRIPIEVLH